MRSIILAFFLISASLTVIFFKDVPRNQFIYIQDEFLVLTKQESFNLFFTQNPTDLGTANTTSLIVTFFDRAYYFTAHYFDLNIYDSEKILYFIKLFLIISLPFLGFRKLSSLFKNKSDPIVIFIISLWYSFNPFTLIYWHGNAFSFTLLLCYAIAPLAFYYFHLSIFDSNSFLNKIKFILLFFLMSFGLFLFAVFCIFLISYTILYTLITRPPFSRVLKNIVILFFLFLPFASILFLIPYEGLSNPVTTVNLAGGETYGNIQGGFLYQLLMWFTWAIYIHWEPRNVYTFYKYFLSIPSLLAPFVLYFLILGGFFKKKKNLFLTLFSFLFLFLIFFAKAAQKPFGEIYLYLINHSTVFRIFRSPDNKLGFGIVLVVAIMLIIVSKEYKKRLFITLIFGVILIQGSLIFSGIAIKGENTAIASDRIIPIDKEYKEMASFLNKNSNPYGYAMPLPSVEVGHYGLSDGSNFIGQDLLPKLTSYPFLYISDYSGMLSTAHSKLSKAIQEKDFKRLEEFPIRYFIIRNDVRRQIIDKSLNEGLSKAFNLVFKNNRFQVFENPKVLPIIQSENIRFTRINPVEYHIQLKNVTKAQKLILFQNFNSNWKLYPTYNKLGDCDNVLDHKLVKTKECITNIKFPDLRDFTYLVKKPLPEIFHTEYNQYANSWVISKDIIKTHLKPNQYKINPDGSSDVELVLFLKTQAVFYAGAIISGVYLLVLSFILLINSIKTRAIKSSIHL